MSFPPCPDSLKAIAHYLKVAQEHNDRDIVVAYWCRLHALQVAMKLCSGTKPPEVTNLLVALMTWLENTKREQVNNEGITNESCAQAMIENYALKLFKYADQQDLAENFGKNVIKAFYTAGLLMDVLTIFGELSDDIIDKRKYAKWKAAYIHNCLKCGDRPVPGPPNDGKELFIPKDEYYSDPANAVDPPPAAADPSPDGNNPWGAFPSVPVDPNHDFTIPTLPDPPAAPSPQWPSFPTPGVTPLVTSTPDGEPSVGSTQLGSGGSVNLSPEQIAKAQKYCKWAASALTYDDINTAVQNLQKALNLLQLGKDE